MSAAPSLSTAGRRKVNRATFDAAQIASQYGEDCIVGKAAAKTLMVQAWADPLKLTPSEWVILEFLFSRSQPQDWEDPNVHPIVWPSNEEIEAKTGRCENTIRAAVKGLVAKGLIAYKDSPNGKRGGFRCPNTHRIVWAYGFDLAPIAVRFREIANLYDTAQKEQRRRKEAKRDYTILRTSILMTINTGLEHDLDAPWLEFQDSLSVLTDGIRPERLTLAELEGIVASLKALKEQVDNAYDHASSIPNNEGLGTKDRGHSDTNYNRTTDSDSCNELRRGAHAPQHQNVSASGAGGFSRKPVRGFAGSQALSPLRPAQPAHSRPNSDSEFSIELVMTACPQMKRFATNVRNWSEMAEAAEVLSRELKINNSAWIEAREVMGDAAAATSVALIAARMEAQECASPGGYLRGLIKAARNGELHLSRSLFKLAGRNAAAAAASRIPMPSPLLSSRIRMD